MDNGQFFLKRCLESIKSQTYTDYEIIITKDGKMAENTNSAIKKAKGKVIKVMYMDDYFMHPNALQNIVHGFESFSGQWLVTGCIHDHVGDIVNPHYARYDEAIRGGENTIGSPSVLAFINQVGMKDLVMFDEKMSWLLDCDLYARLHDRYGPPIVLNDINVVIGIHPGQTTHILTDEEKQSEYNYLQTKP